jgi:hypothetical protein
MWTGASTAKALVDVYNEVRTFFDEQRQIDAPLYGNSLFRGVVDSFTAALRTEVTDNTTYSRRHSWAWCSIATGDSRSTRRSSRKR